MTSTKPEAASMCADRSRLAQGFRPRRRAAPFGLGLGAAVAAACFALATSRAQQPAPQADPRDFGLLVPDAPALPANDRWVLVQGGAGDPVVTKVLVEVGDRLVVVLPDGRLTAVLAREATLTDRPFEPVTMDELAKELTAGKFQGFKTRTTRRYLYVYNTSELFFQGTSRILETMYPKLFAYCKRQKLPVHDPLVPLVAIMFRTQEEFDRYHQMPEGVIAYYSGVSNHVVMYEQSKLVELAPDLAVKQAISTVAHEGVHQILHNIGVQQRLSNWPLWISEGLPEYFAPTTVDRRIRWKGVGFPNDLRMKELDWYLKQAPLAGSSDVVRPTVEAKRLTSTGYAAAWALTHYLAEGRKDRFFAYLAEVSRSQPLETRSTEEEVALFVKHFGGDFGKHDSALVAHLKKLPYVDPVANQTHFVAMLQIDLGGGLERSVAVTTSPAAVEQWQQEQLAAMPANLQGGAKFSVRAFPSEAAAKGFANAWLTSR